MIKYSDKKNNNKILKKEKENMGYIRVGFYIYFHLGGRIDDDDEAVHTLVFTTSPKLENGGVRISLSQFADSCAAAFISVIGGGISRRRIRTCRTSN